MSDSTPKKWLAIDVEADAEAAEAVEYAFNSLESLGTEIDHLRKSVQENLTITGYFHELPDEKLLSREIEIGLRIYDLPRASIHSIKTRKVQDTDWLAEWKRHWKPTEVGKFVIAPPWSDVAATEKIVIRIEPNMAFGTGTHETTQLCLQAIGEHYRHGQTFLDVGTGTGILAIAAAKSRVLSPKSKVKEEPPQTLDSGLGTWDSIQACDTDIDSVKIARENAIANNVRKQIGFFEVSITGLTPSFDFVCANLTIDIILPILPLLIEKTRQILLLSGILAEQEKMIVDELLKFQISDFEIEKSGEWISVLIRKRLEFKL